MIKRKLSRKKISRRINFYDFLKNTLEQANKNGHKKTVLKADRAFTYKVLD